MKDTKLVSNVLVNIVLLLIYICFFGRQSIQKYFDKGTLIVNHEEKPAFVTPPGENK